MISRRTTPNGTLLRLDLEHGERTTLPFSTDDGGPLVSLVACHGSIFVIEQSVHSSRVWRITSRDGSSHSIPLPFDSSIDEFRAEADGRGALLLIEGWADSPRWIRVDATTGEVSTVFADAATRSMPNLRVDHRSARSQDGTDVPLTVVAGASSKDKHADAPTILIGYGAYETSLTPSFSTSRLVWLERGGVIAFAHPRGGGELGREWHLAGMRDRKQNSVDDFVACARALFSLGYTSPAYLGAIGQSAGAIMVGAAMVQQPELFRAVYLDRGVVDILGFLEVSPANREEFGAADSKEHFETRSYASRRVYFFSVPVRQRDCGRLTICREVQYGGYAGGWPAT
jgi:prolyl oligopeptidase